MAGTLSAGNILLDAGTNSAPAIAATSSPTVGIVFPAANTIAFSTASTERLRFDSGTNIFANSAALYVPTYASTANIDFKVGASLNTSFRIESTGRLYNSVDSDTGTDYRSTLYPGTLCRAWVKFDGTLTGTITPNSSFNVTNVTKNGTGNYTVNFITAMPDANYVVCSIATLNDAIVIGNSNRGLSPKSYTTTTVQLISTDGTAGIDTVHNNVIVFR